MYILYLAIAARVLERREHDDVWLDVHDFLYHRIQTIAAVNNASLLNLFLNPGNLDVL